MSVIANTPNPPYYAIIFTSLRTDIDAGYAEMASRMFELASQQPGYIEAETARSDLGITITYWRDLESLKSWKKNTEHIATLENGETNWYSEYKIRICRIDSEIAWTKG